MRTILLILFLSFVSNTLISQLTLTGIVTSAEDGEPLFGVSIYDPVSQLGTVSGFDGAFELILPDTATVSFSYIGYETVLERINTSKRILIELEENTEIIGCPVIYSYPVPLHLPAPFAQLGTTELNRDQNTSLLPTLNRIPGLHMQSGNLNTNRISIRGIGSRSLFSTTKLRVYLDDIPLTYGNGESSLEDLDLSLIDRVEISKGPAATMYGAGLGGLIHLKTGKRGSIYQPSIFSETTLGSYGLFRNSSGFESPIGQGGNYIKGNYHLTSQNGYRSNSGFRREGINFLGRMLVGKRSEIHFLSIYSKVKGFIPSSLNETDYQNNPQQAADSWQRVRGFENYDQFTLGLSFRSNLRKIGQQYLNSTISVFSSLRNGYESRPFNILDDGKQAKGIRAMLSLDPDVFHAGLYPRLGIGLELFQDDYQWQTFETNEGQLGDLLSNNRERRRYYNLFAQYYQVFDQGWTILAGLNFSETNYRYTDLFRSDSLNLSGNYTFQPTLAMRVGLSYVIDNNYSLYANVSNGFSPPSLEETLTPDGSINPEIQPEKGWNFEIGSRGRPYGNLNYQISVYRMIVRDLLVARRIDNDQYVGVNAGQTRHDGLEVYLDYPIYRDGFSFSPFLSYTLTNYKFIDFVDEEEDYSGNSLTGVAPHQLFAGIECKIWQDLQLNLNYEFRSAFPMLDDNSLSTDPYHLMHTKLSYEIALGDNWKVNVFGGIRNIFDSKYASMILINASSFGGAAPRYYYPGMPRHYFVGLNLQLVLD